ncbi:SIMPL domain-containing protein [Sporosarcina sp. Marseille-Q4943]|uniref:SIMPL domain-containing protein n=1 Tax=Sporosarcina sp. Marseille-Q4943 TaxID=2942204 RepID=UPI00208DC7E6|nr:SIMPL domain-containing protein [Sporosarcina sp. Marseille-Q4943]
MHQQVKRASRKIIVIGNGEIAVEPNIATVQLEVVTMDEQLSVAQQENAVTMNNVIQSLLRLGIPQENIKTVSYTISPRYDYIDGQQVFRGYEVSNAISVKITDIQQVGRVIDTAVENGANRVSNIQFTVEDAERYRQEAIVQALRNAQMKARTIATELQVQVEPHPVKILEEELGGQPVPLQSFARTDQVTTPIEGGQIVIAAKLRVQFQY